MAFLKNSYSVEGNVVADPELKFTKTGLARLTFRFVHNNRRKNVDGDWEDVPMWFNVTLFGKDAEDVHPVLTKGQFVVIDGRLEFRDYPKKDGTQGQSNEIIADRVGLLTRVKRAEAVTPNGAAADDLADLPF